MTTIPTREEGNDDAGSFPTRLEFDAYVMRLGQLVGQQKNLGKTLKGKRNRELRRKLRTLAKIQRAIDP